MPPVHRSAAGLVWWPGPRASPACVMTTTRTHHRPHATAAPLRRTRPSAILGVSTGIPWTPALRGDARRAQHGMLTTAQATAGRPVGADAGGPRQGGGAPAPGSWPVRRGGPRRARAGGAGTGSCAPGHSSSTPMPCSPARPRCWRTASRCGVHRSAAPSILRRSSAPEAWARSGCAPTRGESVTTAWGPASDPATALVQHAVDHGIVPGVVSADAALREGIVSARAAGGARLEAVATWPHSSRAASMLRLVDGRRESVGESRCGVTLAMAGIVATPQVTISDESGGFVARVDFLVDGTKVVDRVRRQGQVRRGRPEVLWDEKRREDRLRRAGLRRGADHLGAARAAGAVAAAVRAAVGPLQLPADRARRGPATASHRNLHLRTGTEVVRR